MADDTATFEPAAITSSIEQMTRGEIDIQIATAKRYPRDITVFMKKAETLATLNDDIAAACFYKLPRDGKRIEGPSVRLAEIIAATWGHMRIDARTVNEDDRFVYAQGVAWDLQENVAIRFETRRRITNRQGQRYNDDMIATTANAAAAIGLRNAIFRVVPKAFWEPIYEKAKAVAVGTEQTLDERRTKMVAYYTQKIGVSLERLLTYLGVEGVEGISLQHVEDLRGLATAIKEGDARIDEIFADVPPTEPIRRSEKGAHAEQGDGPTCPAGPLGIEGPPGEGELDPELASLSSEPPPPATTKPATPSPTRTGAAPAKGSKKAAPAPPDSAARFPQLAPAVVTKAIQITDTQVIQSGDAPPYYEIKGRVREKGQAPIGFTWYTESYPLYKAAASCEGSESKVHVTWHDSQKPDGTGCKVITSIEAAE